MQQAIDFRDECNALYALIEPLDNEVWACPTQFKNWTLNDIIAHLYFADYAADLAVRDDAAFLAFLDERIAAARAGATNLAFQRDLVAGREGRALLELWRGLSLALATRFAGEDPKRRLKWFGPDMSVRSSATARLMETWAHGQAIYDLLGVERVDTDRIKNVAVIGMNTFGWTFINRKLDVPEMMPYVRLTAPSGAIWEWHEPSDAERIEGPAADFCQVVTQTRNIADTNLAVTGDVATQWMAIAQCFAGPPEDPPAPGTRFRRPQA